MSYWLSIIDKLLLIVTMYIAFFIYSWRIEWRKSRLLYFFISFAAIIGLCFLFEGTRYLTMGKPIAAVILKNITEILLIVAISASTLLIKQYSRAKFLFVCVASYATFYMADNLNGFFFYLLLGPEGAFSGISPVIENIIRAVMVIVVYILTFIVCWFVFIKRQRNNIEYSADNSVLIVFALLLCVNIFLGDFMDSTRINLSFINRILSCILVLFVLYNQSCYIHFREENARLQAIIRQQISQYEVSKQIIEQTNVKAHDLKHFVEIFSSRDDMPEEVLSELKNIGSKYENIYNTGNKALDITLAEKCSTFSENEIEFSVIADGANISFISDVDIYVLIGNLLDNAKEAVLREREDNRIIALYIRKSDNFISLHIENTCTYKTEFLDGLPLTSKTDKKNHGFGTKSIQLVVVKYGGTLKMYCDGKMFVSDIIFCTG